MRAAQATRESGFTLVELLIGLAIGGLLMGVVTGTIFQATQTGTVTRERLDALHQLQLGTYWLSGDIHRAQTTTVPGDGTTVATAGFDWMEGGVPHSCAYALEGSDLVRSCDGDSTIVSRSVTLLEFSREGALVRVELHITSSEGPQRTDEGILLARLRQV